MHGSLIDWISDANAWFNRQHCIEHSGMAVEAAYKGKAAALCCLQSDTAFMSYL